MSDILSKLEKELNIDFSKGRKVGLVYPSRTVHPALALNVQTTKDGRYVLNYIDFYGDVVSKLYTELNFIDGEWANKPFHRNYDDYEFNPFDQKLSDDILSQLPKQLFFRIKLDNDKKSYDIGYEKKEEEKVLEEKVTEEGLVNDNASNKETLLYMVLIANDGESSINKNIDGGEYNFDMPFPVFSLPYEIEHNAHTTDPMGDVNSDLSFKQNEYLKAEIPMSVRRDVSDFLANDTEAKFDIKYLPIYEYIDQNNHKYVICFVSCNDIHTYSEIYKAESLCTDIDMYKSLVYDNDLESALHNEIPLSISLTNGDVKYNNVRHSIEEGLNR